MLKFTPILTEYSYAQVKDRVYMAKVEAVSEKISIFVRPIISAV